jgi:precorrin-2 dehydrogenase / sirohydrochlorin ferrochelatase
MSRYYPICLDVRGKKCVVVGGGVVAERKVSGLLESGAAVTVIAADLTPALIEWAAAGRIEATPRAYQTGDLNGAVLAIAATGDERVNAAVADDARSAGVLVNVVDDPPRCDFIVPSVVRRGDLTVSVSTGGRSPALARLVREDLERALGPEYEDLTLLVGDVRESLLRSGKRVSFEQWQSATTPELLQLVKRGQIDEARSRLMALVMGGERRG